MAKIMRAAVKLKPGVPRSVLTDAGLKILEQFEFGPGYTGPYYVGASEEVVAAAQVSLAGKYDYFEPETTFLNMPKSGGGAATGDGLDQVYLTSMGILRAWDVTRGAGVRIGVLDAEFDEELDELKQPWDRDRAAYTVFDEEEQPMLVAQAGGAFPGPAGASEHGTNCAALALGRPSAGATIGVAPEAELVPIALGEKVSAIMIARALAYCANPQLGGCKVISVSVGDLLKQNGSQVVLDAVSYVESQGAVIIYAVSNFDGTLVSDDYLAADSRVIATASVDDFNNRIMGATGPELSGVAQTSPALGPAWPEGRELLSPGNSWSAPVIAGIVALIRSNDPNLTACEVRDRLKDTADDLGSQDQFGWGLIRADLAVGLSE